MGFKGPWHQKHGTLLISQGRQKGKSQNQEALPFPVWLGFVCLPHRLFLLIWRSVQCPALIGICSTEEVRSPLPFRNYFLLDLRSWVPNTFISLSGTTGESRKPWRGSRIMMSELEDLRERKRSSRVVQSVGLGVRMTGLKSWPHRLPAGWFGASSRIPLSPSFLSCKMRMRILLTSYDMRWPILKHLRTLPGT